MQSEINRNTILVAQQAGGVLDLVSEDGEVLAEIPVAAGRHKALKFLQLAGPGQVIQVASGIVAFQPTNRIGLVDFGEAKFESAANPEFRVTSAQRQAREFEMRLRKVEIMAQRKHRKEEIAERVSETTEQAVTEKALKAAPVENSEDQAKPGEADPAQAKA